MIYRTSADALVGNLQALLAAGDIVTVRGNVTRELLHQAFTISHPLERAIALAGRHNNVFASIAETVWVMAGRDDLEYLEGYLPRAKNFSDDGTTWRGAYGPRLRNWHGVDQIERVVALLRESPSSRRAVAMIFDPARDFEPSLDIPCTNWLDFTIRDDRLDMAVTVRSNDIIWGFSGINSFEWSVLQEMIASWTGTEVGRVTYFISSLHLYERHFERAEHILAGFAPLPSHDSSMRFSTPFDQFDTRLAEWFTLEQRIRTTGVPQGEIDAFPDALLRDFLRMLQAYWSHSRGEMQERSRSLALVEDGGLAASAASYFEWRDGRETEGQRTSRRSAATEVAVGLAQLHAEKDRVYGDSWRKRGELQSILPNIARKVDRLTLGRESSSSAVEDLLDTAADLFVYATKYKTYLLDQTDHTPPTGADSWAAGTAGVDHVMSGLTWGFPDGARTSVTRVSDILEAIYASVGQNDPLAVRLSLADELVMHTQSLLMETIAASPSITMSIVRSWVA